MARETATTHFVFPSDIELYPSPNLIPSFLDMIKRNDGPGNPKKPRVYVNSIFEIQANVTALPNTKVKNIKMLYLMPCQKFKDFNIYAVRSTL